MSISFEVAAASSLNHWKPLNGTRNRGRVVGKITPKAELLKYVEKTISVIPP